MAGPRATDVAIVYPGDREARRNATPENNRFATLFAAFAAQGIRAEPAVWHEDCADDVRAQLLDARAVLVWVNPIVEGRDRSRLDALLREVAASDVFVSAHPDTILAIGTKDVLVRTRDLGWGCDAHLYASPAQMARELPGRLAAGARVLKQVRGHSGDGVWKVEAAAKPRATPASDTPVRIRHAARGSAEETMPLGAFLERCAPYFAASGRMIDQEYQPRIAEGMVRCYLVEGMVAGFGLQAVNALHPEIAQPGPRLYHPPTLPEYQDLKRRLEHEWVPAAQRLLGIADASLPLLWDADFMRADGDGFVLCEINASSVAPYPDSVVPALVEATARRLAR